MIKHVVFDFDDTLTLTQKAGFKLENLIASELGHKPMSEKIHRETWGLPLPEIISTRVPGIDVEEFMKRVGPKMKELTLKGEFDVITPSTKEMLDKLYGLNIEVSILTSRTKGEVEHLIDLKSDLSKYVPESNFYFKEKTNYRKPDPRVFETFLNDKHINSREVLYVGDSPTDAIASKLAGMFFIASLESGLRKKKDFPKGYVDKFVYILPEIIQVVENPDLLKFNIPKEIASVVETHKISVPHDYFLKNIPELKQ